MNRRFSNRIILFFVLLGVSALAGPLYIWTVAPENIPARWSSAFDGLTGGLFLWGGLLFVWSSRPLTPLRRLSFPLRLAILCAYAMLVTTATAVLSAYWATGRWNWAGSRAGLSRTLYVYVICVVLLVLVVLQVVRMIGPQAIANVLLGRYHKPVEEERIFLFVDLVGSTALARQLGDLGLQRLISRFVFDSAAPIQESRGQIHAYVGDGVIVTWPFRRGARGGDCIRCFFAIQDSLRKQAAAYQAAFGAIPEIRGGLHGGPVVVSEIGDLRTAVVYSGDTVNTAARLEEAAKRHQRELITSKSLFDRLAVPEEMAATELATETLRGHEAPTVLIAITRRAAASG